MEVISTLFIIIRMADKISLSSLLPAKLVKLPETMSIDYFFQAAVGIVAHMAVVVQNHHLTILCRIWIPCRQSLGIGISGMGELCPRTAHQVSQSQVVLCWLRKFVG
jgi:hypothetical protein